MHKLIKTICGVILALSIAAAVFAGWAYSVFCGGDRSPLC